MDFTETIERFCAVHPDVSGVFVESAANGAAAIAALQKKTATKSKYDRAYAASDELNAGTGICRIRRLRVG